MAEPNAIALITPPRVPMLDSRTGLITREWYRFFLNLFLVTGSGGNFTSVEDLQRGPAIPLDTYADIAESYSQAQLASLVAQSETAYADIIQQFGAQPSSISESLFATLSSQIQALDVSPANTPQIPRKRYGAFFDTTNQTAVAINTAYAMTFNNTDTSTTYGVYRGTPTSRIYVDTANVYNIQFSAQVFNSAGGAKLMYIWLRKNGTDISNSATKLRVEGNNTENVAAWNFLLQMNAGDYFELMWAVDDVSLYLLTAASTAFCPAIPSVILTVTDNISV